LGEQWYTNKELFELINELQKDFRDLRSEMRQTREIIKQYNGLRKELGQVRLEIDQMKSKMTGKQMVWEAIRNWGGWLFALITLLILLKNNL